MNTYLRTSKEFQPIVVELTANGITTRVTSGLQYVIVAKGVKLEDGTPNNPVLLGGEPGFYTDQLAVGYWEIGVRVTATPEEPFISCGLIRIK